VISVSDLDARIRAEIKGMADSSHDAASGYFADALCAVLDDADAFDVAGDWAAARCIRTTIARELGVTDD
jgi:hypothetical protein